MTLKMTTVQVVETSVTVTNSSFQNYTHPDDHATRTTDTPGFKPFTIILVLIELSGQIPKCGHSMQCTTIIGNERVLTSTTAKGLGIILEKHISIEAHICNSSFYHLRNYVGLGNISLYIAPTI